MSAYLPSPFFPRRSASVITLYWALKGELKNTLHHTVFLTSDMEAAWRRPVFPEDFAGQRNFYVHNPAISDPSCAPAGCVCRR